MIDGPEAVGKVGRLSAPRSAAVGRDLRSSFLSKAPAGAQPISLVVRI